jgi:hypothetical protein
MLQFFNYGYNFNSCLNLQHEQSRTYTFLKLFFDRKCTFNFSVGCAIIMLTFDFLLFYKNTRNIISQDKHDVFCGLYVPETSFEFLFGSRKNSIWTPKLNLWKIMIPYFYDMIPSPGLLHLKNQKAFCCYLQTTIWCVFNQWLGECVIEGGMFDYMFEWRSLKLLMQWWRWYIVDFRFHCLM